ncbi:tRNA (adenosine(37)-N6)-threonylcarbamoyltransferase complex ATPase subunit type 1 TsaE [Cytophagales bacterium LB-30]|uniref:tRNA threonylcarbamoyladenosine biosynthesis protein TsaE n=1 Tax=Shiella aurantiaca TaxID=3058365 RepID=A0ABT8F4Y0_9BACT|nr:tRNA (adenosine(37)-N6)-threonylcarbamoyltransferase complex ATPase subunit type 1 TsaE [Shiella aurantiaca]MDN4165443.1 tRNA (adenosine(37)-N6)-threonylcarbamoyltransferase complex ATPase subunit type 1 TsaE [Shiella aurantiaca]
MIWENVRQEELATVAREVLAKAKGHTVWLLEGEMGAGKTTFIKALCQELKVKDAVSSPSYALVNQYLSEDGEEIYHFDFYRIKDAWEAQEIGTEEYLASGNLCLIEWSERIAPLLPTDVLTVYITISSDTTRTIRVDFP